MFSYRDVCGSLIIEVLVHDLECEADKAEDGGIVAKRDDR